MAKKRLAFLTLAGLLIGNLTSGCQGQNQSAQAQRAMHPILQNRQTYCLGRFLVDLPHGSELKAAISSTDAEFSVEWNVSIEHYHRDDRVALKRTASVD